MTRKPPTGARHEGCRTHIAHDYLKSGWACVSTYSPADVVAFADDLAAVAMAHRSRELERPRPDAATDPLYTAETRPGADSNGRIVPGTVTLLAPACHEQNGSSHWSASVHVHPSAAGFSAQHLPYDSAADRESRAGQAARFRLRSTAPDTYAAAVATVQPVKVAPEPEPEPVQPEPADEPEPVQVAPDALTLCNACDVAPALPDSPAGYCVDCERDAREPEPEPVSIAPEPAPVLAALPAITPDGRPTCERCGQVFRKHGAGADWHRVNRPDCAGARPALTIAS